MMDWDKSGVDVIMIFLTRCRKIHLQAVIRQPVHCQVFFLILSFKKKKTHKLSYIIKQKCLCSNAMQGLIRCCGKYCLVVLHISG